MVSGFLIAVTVLLIVFFVSENGIMEPDRLGKERQKLPCLVDVGADNCPPCARMKPVLEDLKKEYAGVLVVEIVDAGKSPEAGQRYGVRSVPTQIFYDADGKELKRHLGFISKQDILDEFKKSGISLKPADKEGT